MDKCSRGRYQPLLLLYALPQPPAPTNGYQSDASISSSNTAPNRRAITPSPEKTQIGLTRRAITPTPNRAMCEYQNLSVIQNKIFGGNNNNNISNGTDETDAYISRRAVETIMNAQQYQNLNVIQEKIFYNNSNNLTSSGNSSSSSEEKEYISRSQLEAQMAKKQQLGRSLSAESTSVSSSPSQNSDGLSIPDHLNQPRRRDSGNWSGDRNSASSSSSTTLDNPYLYLMNKRNNNVSSMPPSPTRNGQFYDAGYDSYSLSSTDSYPPKQHPINAHLAKIPEALPMTGDCEKLCLEADQLLEKSKLVEDAHDFETALVLCNAAAGKARAAMNAPYSNPHTMTFARMKHNTCVMRARSLYRRILMEKGSEFAKDQVNANSLNAPRHGRQNSKDKTMQRQNSKEMLQEEKPTIKNIEIYATLPKKKVSLKLVDQEDQIVAIEPINNSTAVVVENKKTEREGRSLFGRSKDSKEKRSRSEDRNKASRDFESSTVPVLTNAKDTLKKHKEEKDEKKDKDKTNKKQHKIRRKLLMGGLIRRKNRSMPDLTEGAADAQNKENSTPPQKTVDDSVVGSPKIDSSVNSGYLSEGHLEYHVSNVNPTLERSKLMRKSFHGSGRQLVVAKVPPPPPLRKTSALTRELVEEHHMQQKNLSFNDEQQIKPFHEQNMSIISNVSSNTSMSEDSCQTIITCAQVHQEQSPLKPGDIMPPPTNYQQKFLLRNEQTIDEVDHIVPHHTRFNSQLDLPPYPSPPVSTCHSRQASDQDFPPPPPSIDLEPLNEQLNEIQNLQIKRTDSLDTMQGCTSILAHLQQRQEAMKARDNEKKIESSYTSENWLKELQMKQLTLKKMQIDSTKSVNENSNNVASLASRFEQVKMSPIAEPKRLLNVRTGMNGLLSAVTAIQAVTTTTSSNIISTTPHTIKRMDNGEEVEYAIVDKKKNNHNQLKFSEVSQSQVQEELREVEMLNQVVQNTLNNSNPPKRTKKKSVSFCDQVILVATANDDEDETFVPNPILERVLKSINGGNNSEDESKDQVDTPKSCVISTKQIPLQAPHESTPASPYMSPPIVGLPQKSSPPSDDGFGYQSIEQIQKPVYQAPPPPNTQSLPPQQTQIYPPPQPTSQQQQPILQMSLQRPGLQQQQQQQYHEMKLASVVPNQQHMSMPNQFTGMQQSFDYVANQGSGLTNLGIPLQSQYMQVPPNSSVASGYLSYNNNNNNINANRPIFPQNPLAQPPPNQMQLNAHYMMNARMYQQQQQQNVNNVYQKPPQMMTQPPHEFQNAYPYQSPYQRVPYMSEMPFEPPSQPLPPQQLPINPLNPLSPLHQNGNNVYLSPPQMQKPMQKKVSFGPDTKGNDGGNNSPAPSTTSSTSDANNNNVMTSPTQVIATKVAFTNNSIVKSTAKSSLCNLCRKQHAIGTSLYCANCDSYLARFNGNNVRR